ncbi:hypothetical protein D6789_02175 [Candidatus Woesearchaeota archaeon]|nr:MAG: hypothetical protein D6789_02175 [Candidatus Woesearchaeota archaeon]
MNGGRSMKRLIIIAMLLLTIAAVQAATLEIGESTTEDGVTVTLLSVKGWPAEPKAILSVNGKTEDVKEGKTKDFEGILVDVEVITETSVTYTIDEGHDEERDENDEGSDEGDKPPENGTGAAPDAPADDADMEDSNRTGGNKTNVKPEVPDSDDNETTTTHPHAEDNETLGNVSDVPDTGNETTTLVVHQDNNETSSAPDTGNTTNNPANGTMPPAFPDNETNGTEVRLRLDKGWNLVTLPGHLRKFVATPGKKILGFVYIVDDKEYLTMREARNRLGEDFSEYLATHAFWIYAYEERDLVALVEPFIIQRLDVTDGWNLLPIIDPFVNENIISLDGTCDLRGVYTWDSGAQRWSSWSSTQNFLRGMVGEGLLIKSANDCTLAGGELVPPSFLTKGAANTGAHDGAADDQLRIRWQPKQDEARVKGLPEQDDRRRDHEDDD